MFYEMLSISRNENARLNNIKCMFSYRHDIYVLFRTIMRLRLTIFLSCLRQRTVESYYY